MYAGAKCVRKTEEIDVPRHSMTSTMGYREMAFNESQITMFNRLLANTSLLSQRCAEALVCGYRF